MHTTGSISFSTALYRDKCCRCAEWADLDAGIRYIWKVLQCGVGGNGCLEGCLMRPVQVFPNCCIVTVFVYPIGSRRLPPHPVVVFVVGAGAKKMGLCGRRSLRLFEQKVIGQIHKTRFSRAKNEGFIIGDGQI